MIPYAHNPLFTGRKDVLKRLIEAHKVRQTVVLSQSQASRSGGIGKTQVAVEYAYRARHYNQTVLWARAETVSTLISSYISIARFLELPERNEQDQRITVQAVMHWLASHHGWLLVFDDAHDLSLVQEFMPAEYTGQILLITRAQKTGEMAYSIQINRMEQEEGALFLLRRISRIAPAISLAHASVADVTLAREICEVVAGLPLALELAGAYIKQTHCSLAQYLQRVRVCYARRKQRRSGRLALPSEPIAVTCALAVEYLEQRQRAAVDVLRLCTFLDPDMISQDILKEAMLSLDERPSSSPKDSWILEEALEILDSYGLLQRYVGKGTVQVHREVQAALKVTMDEAMCRYWALRARRAVAAIFLAQTQARRWQGEHSLLHALTCCAQEKAQDRQELLESVSLLRRVGGYLEAHMRYREAEPLYRRALTIDELVYGPIHLDVAMDMASLARLAWSQENSEQAVHLYLWAQVIWEQLLGPEHPTTVQCLTTLAFLVRQQGKNEQTESLSQQVLRIAERQWGPEHPYTASCLARVAEIAKQQGKDEQAEHLYQRVLAIAEQQWGPVHPYTASYLNTLALLYAHCGKDEQAQDYSQRARAIWEQVLKPPNPYPAGREASIRGRKKKTDVPTHQVQPQLVNIGQEKNS